jgi:hypothetical protein
MRTHKASVFAATGLGLLTALATASPSLAASVTSAQLVPSGTINAKGAAVTISVTYTCASDQGWNSVSAQVTEKVGNQVARAYVYGGLICDGATHTADLVGPAQDVPFKVGTAFVQGSVWACDDNGCVNTEFSGDVRLKK